MTQDIRYALTFIAEISHKPWCGPVTIERVARHYKLSAKFLEQVVGKLKKVGILWSYRGRGGGYGLVKDTAWSVTDVYRALGHKFADLSCSFPTDCRGGAKCVQKEIEARLTGKINDEMAKTLLC